MAEMSSVEVDERPPSLLDKRPIEPGTIVLGALAVVAAHVLFPLLVMGSQWLLIYLGLAIASVDKVRPTVPDNVIAAEFVRLGNGVPHYPVVLLTSIVLFTFFVESTAGAVTSVLDRENLVRKIEFPRLAVPMSTVLTACFNLGLNLVPVTLFLLASGGERVRANASVGADPLLRFLALLDPLPESAKPTEKNAKLRAPT
jgi:hypothetical protein